MQQARKDTPSQPPGPLSSGWTWAERKDSPPCRQILWRPDFGRNGWFFFGRGAREVSPLPSPGFLWMGPCKIGRGALSPWPA